MLNAQTIRSRLVFDVERLRDAAWRLERIDGSLGELRRHLEARARRLSQEATLGGAPEQGGETSPSIRYAQAHATAHLARRAAMKEILSGSTLALIASMAVSRWVAALRGFNDRRHGEGMVRAQIEAGRIAYRMLVSLRRRRGLIVGVGQLTAAVVVAEFVHAEDRPFVEEQLEEGLYRGLRAKGVKSEEDALAAVSVALREAAYLLERMAGQAEPALAALLEEADEVEQKVERQLTVER